jgi:sterol desaturase/sphingolipid hydroxylase (fatty acid hydroxylase superfamily)
MTMSLLDPQNWMYFGGFWLLLIALSAIELRWPLHASPAQPNGRLLTNFGMGLINNGLLALLPVSLIAAAEWAKAAHFGLLNLVPAPWAASAVITVLLRSLAGYWLHRLLHRIGLLWRIHRIHHCDVAVDLSTGFRSHPLEALFIAAMLTPMAAILGFAPLSLVVYESTALIFALWAHANLRLPRPIEPVVRAIFVTPDMHHVHHSAQRPETDSNYGDLFSFWDRLFSTYCALDRNAVMRIRFGLDDAQAPASILHQLGSPLRRGRLSVPPADDQVGFHPTSPSMTKKPTM